MDEQLSVDKNPQEFASPVAGGNNASEASDHKQQQMAEEFNAQRAKMKELFLQKEEEVRRTRHDNLRLESELESARQELVQLKTLSENQRSEIQSLTLLVQETVEVSSSESNEVRQLRARCADLEAQLAKQQQQEVSLAPSVLVQAVTKSIARKLGADPDKPDTLDDSMKRAQEDAELLRSLVVPLEEEIKVLKDKLRDTDTQLQQALSKKTKSEGVEGQCDMCANYEAQLVAEQGKCAEEEKKARHASLALKMATEELEKAASLHAETLETWKTEQTASEQEIAALRSTLEQAEAALASARDAVASADQNTLRRLTELTVQRETLQEQLDRLEQENASLCGKYSRRARDMQLEEISLPTEPEELQLTALRFREELIAACVGRETAVAAEEALRSELLAQGGVVREHIQRCELLSKENQSLREQLAQGEAERAEARALGERLRAADAKLQDTLIEKGKLSDQVAELRARVSSLQTDLDNSEKVQQDFVRLSQSLQVQLERIREADTEVRWQHDEDVSECTACRAHLQPNKRKLHCRHCGRIFCAPCLSRTVLAGPRKAPCHVCTVCHTLLERNTRPYFSTEAPQSPD